MSPGTYMLLEQQIWLKEDADETLPARKCY